MSLRLLSVFIFLLNMHFASARDKNLELAYAALKQANEVSALALFKQVFAKDSNNIEATLEISKIQTRLGHRLASKAAQLAQYNNSVALANKVITKVPNNAEAYYAKALALGRIILLSDSKTKIALSKVMYACTEKCVSIQPTHGYAWHILAKYHWEMSQLNYIEKTAIKAMGGLPPASEEKAIQYFELCKKFEPAYLLNLYDLAKALNKQGKKDKAIIILQSIPNIKNTFQDDNMNRNNANILLKKLTSL
jgi:hypothetical protein